MLMLSSKVMRQCNTLRKNGMQFLNSTVKNNKTTYSSLSASAMKSSDENKIIRKKSFQSTIQKIPSPSQPPLSNRRRTIPQQQHFESIQCESQQQIETIKIQSTTDDSTIQLAPTSALSEKERLQQERAELAKLRVESANMFKTHLTTLPELSYPNRYKVICTSSVEEANRHLVNLIADNKKNGSGNMFGLDLEWPPNFVKGKKENKVSLVQICSANGILLIQVSRMPSIPIELKKFFESKELLKSGVNIGADGLKLYRDFNIVTNGLVELRDLAESSKSPQLNVIHLRSLRALTGLFLNQNMAKGKVRISNWAKAGLTSEQIKYAALDAFASYELFVVLDKLCSKHPIRHLTEESLEKEQEKAPAAEKKKEPSSQYQQAQKPVPTQPSFPSSTTTIIKKNSSPPRPPLYR